ncbi:hypothetical protein GCM10027291_41870 [Telluribacter humicola]
MKGDCNYTEIFSIGGKRYLTSYPMRSYLVAAPGGFCRIHKQHIINLAYLLDVDISTKSVQLTDGTSIVVARRRWNHFMDQVNRSKS